MLESEAMAILVGAGVSYGRREAALRAAGSALAILAEPELYAAQLQEKGLALLRHALADEARLLDGLAKKKICLLYTSWSTPTTPTMISSKPMPGRLKV